MLTPQTRILIVDDMPSMRQLIRKILRDGEFKDIREADNGENGWKVLEEQEKKGEPIEFILSDWNMPVMTGLAFLKKVREVNKAIPFMMITAEADIEQIHEAIASGVSNYVVKPFAPNTFIEKFKAVWKKHHPEG